MSMKLLQLYYTSCKQGRSSGTGFQVYSHSEGLTEEEIVELERICMYVPPSHLPSQPTEEEIKNEFPVLFSSFQLQSGRYGICQSVYVGKDYSERYGNYFSHCLILEEGKWPFAPILLYGSPILRTNLTKAELEITHTPDYLPAISLERPNGSISFLSVQNFLRKNNRYDYLKKMLNGLLEDGSQPGSLILTDEMEHIPYWIAAIQLAFPNQIANQLSFSTYVYDPDREDYIIAATLDEGTRFSFAENMRRSDFCGFNFLQDVHSHTENEYRYTETVVANELEFNDIDTFMKGFTITQPTTELDSFLDLKTIYKNQFTYIEPSRIQHAFTFAKNYLSSEKAFELMRDLPTEKLRDLSNDKNTAKIVSQFLIDVSQITRAELHQETAAQFIVKKVYDFISEYDPEEIELFFHEQMNLIDTYYVRKSLLEDSYLIELENNLHEIDNVSYKFFYLKLATDIITSEKTMWNALSKVQQQFLLHLMKDCVPNPIFSLREWQDVTKDATFFADAFLHLYEHEISPQLQRDYVQFFIDLLDTNDDNEAWTDRCFEQLSQSVPGSKLLQYQFKKRIEQSNSIQEMSTIVQSAVQFSQIDVSQVIVQYGQKLLHTDENIMDYVTNIIKNDKVYATLDQFGVLPDIIKRCENEIVFTDEAVEKHLDVIETFANSSKKVNLFALTSVTYNAKLNKRKYLKVFESTLEAYVTSNEKKLNVHAFQSYLIWSLPEIIELTYAKRKQALGLQKKVIKAYPKLMLHALAKRNIDTKIKFAPELLVDILIGFDRKGWNKESHELMVEYFVDYESDFKKVNELVKKQKTLEKIWNKLAEDVQAQQKTSIVGSIKKLFGSRK